jgi:hypothetical protein
MPHNASLFSAWFINEVRIPISFATAFPTFHIIFTSFSNDLPSFPQDVSIVFLIISHYLPIVHKFSSHLPLKISFSNDVSIIFHLKSGFSQHFSFKIRIFPWIFPWIFQALEMQLFPLLLGVTGLSPLFGAFAAVNVAGALAVFHLVPETSGRSLEEVELQLWQDRNGPIDPMENGWKMMELGGKWMENTGGIHPDFDRKIMGSIGKSSWNILILVEHIWNFNGKTMRKSMGTS